MADQRNGGIAWTDETWNPVRGCSRVSDGCRNCYAETMAARFCGAGQPYEGTINPETKRWNGTVRLVPEKLTVPLLWSRPRMVFVNSMSDLFHEDVPDEFIDQVFAVMALAQQHTFEVLTKRPERMLEYFQNIGGTSRKDWVAMQMCRIKCSSAIQQFDWPLNNVWLGVTVENQEAADERIPLLLQTPAAVRWVSIEPLLGPVDLSYAFGTGKGSCPMHLAGVAPEGLRPKGEHHLHWVVVGGESGTNARPLHPDWARSLRDQCYAAGVPFLFKQWGEFAPDPDLMRANCKDWSAEACMVRVGKKAAGRLLDGVLHDEYPVGAT